VVSSVLPTSVGEAQATEPAAPSATVSPQTIAVGGVIQVTGVGWQPGSLVVVEVCGNRAVRGSLDCVAAGRQTDIDRQGALRTSLTVSTPPSPCPCVVAVSAVPGPDRAVLPLQIAGAPETPSPKSSAPSAPAPRLVVDAELEGSGPWSAWFGASGKRTLVLTVRNTGTAPADMRLAVAAGAGDTRDVAIGVDDPGRLEPGASRALRIPIQFDPLAFGRQTVSGEIAAPGAVAPFKVRTSVYPWGLLVVALVLVLLLVLLALRKVRRRRVARADAARASSELADSADAIDDWDEDGDEDDWDEGWEDEGWEDEGRDDAEARLDPAPSGGPRLPAGAEMHFPPRRGGFRPPVGG
jgi:hypothetical protein